MEDTRSYVWYDGEKLAAKDIHNARQRARGMNDSQEEQLLRVLEEIVENETEAVVQLFTNVDGEVTVIYLQTTEMMR